MEKDRGLAGREEMRKRRCGGSRCDNGKDARRSGPAAADRIGVLEKIIQNCGGCKENPMLRENGPTMARGLYQTGRDELPM